MAQALLVPNTPCPAASPAGGQGPAGCGGDRDEEGDTGRRCVRCKGRAQQDRGAARASLAFKSGPAAAEHAAGQCCPFNLVTGAGVSPGTLRHRSAPRHLQLQLWASLQERVLPAARPWRAPQDRPSATPRLRGDSVVQEVNGGSDGASSLGRATRRVPGSETPSASKGNHNLTNPAKGLDLSYVTASC